MCFPPPCQGGGQGEGGSCWLLAPTFGKLALVVGATYSGLQARSHKADPRQPSRSKIRIGQHNGSRIGVWLAGNLTAQEITMRYGCKYQRRTELGTR